MYVCMYVRCMYVCMYVCMLSCYLSNVHVSAYVRTCSYVLCVFIVCVVCVCVCVVCVYREDVREYGFSVVVDSRNSNWHSTKQVLHSLQEVLPGQVGTCTYIG